ncbi:hypothetical protein PFICI_00125 [Pestalotiopsis fici W106-1]|uniref:Uncharacterized protein n=1 Tax=Pestalotiopsis fici (strain W106-1 / CGMCC3.15140) TaxID=1229662 RepID=W3XLG8_PESFW|nr:uncharacterized protein PFICI_00125 [Pestalotiopsis fici W106-1]ETS86297.1 hypothetical protein PFICI_00125 [Pestalotiopsis fici W106-1]
MRIIKVLVASLLPVVAVHAAPSAEADISPRGQSCSGGQYWDDSAKCCKCPNGKEWQDNKCKHPPMPKPNCKGNEHACCAKDKNDWCAYDESKKECRNNGKHVTFCAQPGKEQEWCDDYWG